MAPSKFDRKQSDMMKRIDFEEEEESNPVLAAILGATGIYVALLLLLSL